MAATPTPTQKSAPVLVYEVNGVKREHRIEKDCSIGRLAENEVCIDHPSVSRRHARIEVRDGQYRVIDCQSFNGTRVNGQPIQSYPLFHGDRIQIEDFEVVFQMPGEQTVSAQLDQVTFTTGKTLYDVEIKAEESLFLAESMDDLRRANENLNLIQSVASDMCELMESRKLLGRIMNIVGKIFTPDQGAVLILDEATGEMLPAATHDTKDGRSIAVSKTILEEVRKKKVGVLSNDVQSDTRFNSSQSIAEIGIGSTMCAPLIARNHFLGMIYLISYGENKRFGENGLKLLMGIGNQAAIGIENNRLQEQITEELKLRSHLERYVSAPLVEGIVNKQITIEPGGQKRIVSCLFSDIKGFTSISENLPPEGVVDLLNEYFDLMVDAVFSNSGTLDKYAGDGLMAVWGGLVPVENHARSAIEAARAMLKSVTELNLKRRQNNQPEFIIRIGINSGEAICGNIGSSRRMEYTVIGDTVNVASRLESQAPPGGILISDHTRAIAGADLAVVPFGELSLKGKERQIKTFVVSL